MEITTALEHCVIESSDVLIRNVLSRQDPLKLKKKHSNRLEVQSREYSKREREVVYHDLTDTGDPGYTAFYDEFHNRHILVTNKEVGKSKQFHDEYDIKYLWNVIHPESTHAHSNDMTPHLRAWFIINIQHVCLQMFEAEGNIALFCFNGRSRSPMYLVAYFILFCNMSLDRAMFTVNTQLLNKRNERLDRHYCLYGLVAEIAELFVMCCDVMCCNVLR